MASQVDIVNKALIKLGITKTVTTIDEGSTEADLANTLWDMIRDESLQEGPEKGWKFASKRVNLVMESQLAPPVDFRGMRFKLPDDTLGIRDVMVDGLEITDWQREGEYLVSFQAEALDVKYIMQITDWTLFPTHFVKYLAQKLAHAMAFALTQSRAIKDDMLTELLQDVGPDAIGRDAKEQFVQEESSAWIDAGRIADIENELAPIQEY